MSTIQGGQLIMIDKCNMPHICRVRADNGEHSHYILIDSATGLTLWEEKEETRPRKDLSNGECSK